MADTIDILSGTRDELGTVEVAIANVYERPERPGGLSGLLILGEDDRRVIAAGDEIGLAGGVFRLEAIRPHRSGGHLFVFLPLPPAVAPAAPRRALADLRPAFASHAIPAVSPGRLARLLRDFTPLLLAGLGETPPTPEGWEKESRESWSTQWNGERLGPSTHLLRQARFAAGPRRVEASVRHEIIRWSERSVARSDVTGFWRLDETTLSLFAHSSGREESEGPVESVSSDDLSATALERLRAAIAGRDG